MSSLMMKDAFFPTKISPTIAAQKEINQRTGTILSAWLIYLPNGSNTDIFFQLLNIERVSMNGWSFYDYGANFYLDELMDGTRNLAQIATVGLTYGRDTFCVKHSVIHFHGGGYKSEQSLTTQCVSMDDLARKSTWRNIYFIYSCIYVYVYAF
ncbi:hypothetical protein CEXT_641421 [Caerostris extrusa]|uniref:Uncharacterized protein n=1 Tax=Caerostris extrusa TaxID=172846 RepID=A0AAV4SRV9_CAEEX|nr:hypothetical protein CEXT_641421 [Caerostris extrusa]